METQERREQPKPEREKRGADEKGSKGRGEVRFGVMMRHHRHLTIGPDYIRRRGAKWQARATLSFWPNQSYALSIQKVGEIPGAPKNICTPPLSIAELTDNA